MNDSEEVVVKVLTCQFLIVIFILIGYLIGMLTK